MKKAFFIAAAAAMLFASCGNNNTKTDNKQAQNEPAVEEAVTEEPVAAEPAAPETTTWDHYEWTLTMPNEGWKVSNAYSEMGVETKADYKYFQVKDYTKTTVEECTKNYPAESHLEDIVTGDYTWTVISNAGKYKLACYSYDPSREMVIRVATEDIDDPKDERLMTILKGFSFKPKQ